MVETSDLCNACGSYSVPKRAKFCPNCGARVANESGDNGVDHVPMVPAVPVSVAGTAGTNTSSSDAPLRVSAVSVEHCSNATPVSTLGSSATSASAAPVATSDGPTLQEETSAERTNATFTSPTTNSSINNNPDPVEPSGKPFHSVPGNDYTDQNALAEPAMFWKNPSPAMLERASKYQAMGGILFLATACHKGGKFTLPKTIHCGQILTGNKLDLSRADFVFPVTTIIVGTILGGMKVIVPRGVRVETTGFGILGGFKGLPSQTVNASQVDNAPLLIVQGLSILGGAKVSVNHDVPPVQVIP